MIRTLENVSVNISCDVCYCMFCDMLDLAGSQGKDKGRCRLFGKQIGVWGRRLDECIEKEVK